jgi:isoleucyl-tRNA synthetase
VLDTTLDDALRREGFAREFSSLMQNARKTAGLEVTDHIRVRWTCEDAHGAAAIQEFTDDLKRELLADELGSGTASQTIDVNGVTVSFSLEKA